MKNYNDTTGNRTRDLPAPAIFMTWVREMKTLNLREKKIESLICATVRASNHRAIMRDFVPLDCTYLGLMFSGQSVAQSFFRAPCRCSGDMCQAHSRLRLKCDGTRAETRFRLSAKRTSPFKTAGASVQSTTGSRGVRISGSNAGYTMFRGSVKRIGYPLNSLVSPSLPLPCVTVQPSHFNWSLYSSITVRDCVG